MSRMFLWRKFIRKELLWTWSREAHLRQFAKVNNQCVARNFADNSFNSPTGDKDQQIEDQRGNRLESLINTSRAIKQKTSPIPLVEKVRADIQRTRQKSKKRVLTPQEVVEEEKFAKFLSSRTTLKDDNFGTMNFEKQRDAEGKTDARYSHNAKKSNLLDEFSVPASNRKSSLPDDWTENFGTLSPKDRQSPVEQMLDPGIKYQREIHEKDKLHEIYHHVPLGNRNRPHPPDWYARRIQKLGKAGHTAEAIEVFEKWMIERDRVKPTDYEYNIMISLLGKVGHSGKAIALHNEMVRKGYKVIPQTYTSLFNAIANSPVPSEEVERAHWLRDRMIKIGVIPEYITYQSMIKAFGMCGDLKTAFEVADEAIHFHGADDNLLTSLLVACISDKNTGFKHAIAVWRKCQKLGVKPEIRGYKLLLKAAQDCDVGNQKLLKQMLIKEIDNARADIYQSDIYQLEPPFPQSVEPGNAENNMVVDDIVQKVEVQKDAPEKHTKTGEKLGDLEFETIQVQPQSTDPEFCETKRKEMIEDPCTEFIEASGPDNSEADDKSGNSKERALDKVKLTLGDGHNVKDKQQIAVADAMSLLPSILDPSPDFSKIVHLGKVETQQDRFALIGGLRWFLRNLKENRIKPDKEIFKYLIGLASDEDDKVLDEMIKYNVKPDISFCNKYLTALVKSGRSFEHVLDMMKKMKISPDIKTYTALAAGCKTRNMAEDFLKTMEKGGFMPNLYVFLTLMVAAKMNFAYKEFLLRKMQELDIRPDRMFLVSIEKGISATHAIVKDMDEGKRERSDQFLKGFDKFLTFYEKWLKEVDVEPEEKPWKKL